MDVDPQVLLYDAFKLTMDALSTLIRKYDTAMAMAAIGCHGRVLGVFFTFSVRVDGSEKFGGRARARASWSCESRNRSS